MDVRVDTLAADSGVHAQQELGRQRHSTRFNFLLADDPLRMAHASQNATLAARVEWAALAARYLRSSTSTWWRHRALTMRSPGQICQLYWSFRPGIRASRPAVLGVPPSGAM